MIFVVDIDDDIRHVVGTDGADTVMLRKMPDFAMPREWRISRALPHPILCEYADKTIDIVRVDRVAIDLYEPRTFVLDLQSYYQIHNSFS